MTPVRVRCMGAVCILHSVWIELIDGDGFWQGFEGVSEIIQVTIGIISLS